MKIMCEWLSCGEWCDVYLLCGGHTFSAHRAVLASVSTFLRQVLLSCSTEEAPTFIVLPEFDLDIISLVLYYIYNGEVVIQKNQLETFLDTINEMQIFVDSQFLPRCNDLVQKVIPKNGASAMICSNDKRNEYVNLKRDINFNHVLNNMQQSLSYTDSDKDKRESYLQSQWYDRQRQSFSRNLFIETYSLNGNSNGVAGGVLAISNERYLEPKSVLLTNSNAENLKANSLLNTSPKKILFERQKQYVESYHEKCYVTNIYDIYKYQNKIIRNRLDTNMLYGSTSSKSNNGVNNKDLLFKLIDSTKETSKKCLQKPVNLKLVDCNTGIKDDVNRYTKCKENITKVTIFNEVLQSPWRPRLPNNYRPLRKKSSLDFNLRPGDNTQQLLNDKKLKSTFSELTSSMTTDDDSVIQNSYLSFKCNFCEQVFSDPSVFDVHVKQHTGSRYTCLECHKTFSQLRNYKYHMSVHRGTKEFATTCPVCGKYFNDKGYLSSHMKIHRNRKEYKCSICPKSFNQRVAYNMHVRIHTGVKPHLCDECGKAFSRKMLLKQHQRTHSGERPYACTYCDKRFADRSNMTLHFRLHTGVKPFACTLCSKSFTKKHHLKSHLNFHTGLKPYACPRCALGFTQSSNMRTHLKKCSVTINIL